MSYRPVAINADFIPNGFSVADDNGALSAFFMQLLSAAGWSTGTPSITGGNNLYNITVNATVDTTYSTNDIYSHFQNDLLPSWIVTNMGVTEGAVVIENSGGGASVRQPTPQPQVYQASNPNAQTNVVNVPKPIVTPTATQGLLSTFINSATGQISTMGIVVLGMLGLIVLTQKK
jgi:hypothetical protein